MFAENFTAILMNEHEEVGYEWEGYDGWYNNPAHPDWGGAGNVRSIIRCVLHASHFCRRRLIGIRFAFWQTEYRN